MSRFCTLGCVASVMGSLGSTSGAVVIWGGPTATFTKPDYAAWTQPQNQDRITPNVWITRADNQGLFNIKQESFFSHSSSPSGTRWADGTAANWQSLAFTDWETWTGHNPSGTVGRNAVLHLIADDIYLDIKFLSWTALAGGGGFSYARTTAPEPVSLTLCLAVAALLLRTKC